MALLPLQTLYTDLSSQANPMTFTSWSAAPKGTGMDHLEFFTSEEHAVDVAFDWSIELGGAPIVIYCNEQEWMEVTA